MSIFAKQKNRRISNPKKRQTVLPPFYLHFLDYISLDERLLYFFTTSGSGQINPIDCCSAVSSWSRFCSYVNYMQMKGQARELTAGKRKPISTITYLKLFLLISFHAHFPLHLDEIRLAGILGAISYLSVFKLSKAFPPRRAIFIHLPLLWSLPYLYTFMCISIVLQRSRLTADSWIN